MILYFSSNAPSTILVRGTNWVGDAIMTLPALEALTKTFPKTNIYILAPYRVRAIYENAIGVTSVINLDLISNHVRFIRRVLLINNLKTAKYDWSILFQNAFEAALIIYLARIPIRIGYAVNARQLLLTNPVTSIKKNKKINKNMRQIHETAYYLYLLYGAGIIDTPPLDQGIQPHLSIRQVYVNWALNFFKNLGLANKKRLLGISPGASFGPAKRWPVKYFIQATQQIMLLNFEGIILFGNANEAKITSQIASSLSNKYLVVDLAGITTLDQALALLPHLSLFITNDSGLMHAAAAQGVPTVAIFGSTNPNITRPLGPLVKLVYKPVSCSPCLKPVCPKDMRCLLNVKPFEVVDACSILLARQIEKNKT